jgi:hypothetical protein
MPIVPSWGLLAHYYGTFLQTHNIDGEEGVIAPLCAAMHNGLPALFASIRNQSLSLNDIIVQR